MTLAAAHDDMRRVAATLEQQYPDSNTGIGAVVVPIKEDALGNTRVELLVLMGAAAAVLLIACANLASLLLSRAVGRRGELAVRAALGATRGRLVRQMVIEAATVALAGGAIGLALAPAGTAVMAQLTPRGFAALPSSVLDLRLLAFTLALSLVTSIAFSLMPALQASRVSLQDALQQGARASVGGRGRADARRAGRAAGGGGAGAAGRRRPDAAHARQPARDRRRLPADHLMTLRTTLPTTRYQRSAEAAGVLHARDRGGAPRCPASSTPRTSRTCRSSPPGDTIFFAVEGGVPPKPGDPQDALYRVGTPGYLSTIDARLVEGRLLDERDVAGAPRAVVVNETLARRHSPASRRSATSCASARRTRRCSPSSASSRTCTSAATSWR